MTNGTKHGLNVDYWFITIGAWLQHWNCSEIIQTTKMHYMQMTKCVRDHWVRTHTSRPEEGCSSSGHAFHKGGENDAHYNDVIMSALASQITGVSAVYSTVFSGADLRKYQSSSSVVFVCVCEGGGGGGGGGGEFSHKGPVTRKMFPFDVVIVEFRNTVEFV